MTSTTSSGRTQCTRDSIIGEPERVERGSATLERHFLDLQRSKAPQKLGELIGPKPGSDPADVNHPAGLTVVPEQQGADEPAATLGIGPADNDKLLAVEAFGFEPQDAIT